MPSSFRLPPPFPLPSFPKSERAARKRRWGGYARRKQINLSVMPDLTAVLLSAALLDFSDVRSLTLALNIADADFEK
jgi:hypothetical protein